MRLFIKHKFTTTQMITGGFFLAIFLGGLILTLPIASKSREFTPFVDALFMSTTSVCVTGLTTVVTVEHWSLFGQFVILFLMQLGGLGVVTFLTGILLVLKKRVTLKDRLLIQEAYNLSTLKGLVKLTIKIAKGAFLVEGIGAIIYSIQFIPEYGIMKGVWYSIFHAVSAFCNAGIDLIGPTGFFKYQLNPIINLNTMMLIIMGGIGFPVWWDIISKIKMKRKDKTPFGVVLRKFELHTKIAITVTVILILFGATFIFINEFSNDSTIGNMNVAQKIMASFFESVTFRTAGFSTIPQEHLKVSSALIGVILMFIGGSPSGTAGGIKTVTFAVLVIAAVSSVKGKHNLEVYGRRLDDGYVKKSLAIFLFSFTTLMVSTICLSLTMERDLIDILYETASALGTVGLSRNLTPSLPTVGKYIIILTMYLGRIGPLSLALALKVGKNKGKGIQLPEDNVLVG